jgi:hypothetical protein
MIVTGISTEFDKYYALDKKTIIKNVFNPVTREYAVEYIQYFYNKVGELEATKSKGTNLDRYV